MLKSHERSKAMELKFHQ